MRRSSCVAIALASALTVATATHAARADDTAVALTTEAATLFTNGDYAAALDRYLRADALVRRQTIVLRIARCLDKLGRWLEALDRYQSVLDMELSSDLEPRKRALQEEAIAQAKTERAELLTRVPTVTIHLAGPADALAEARVTVDQKPIETSKLSSAILLEVGAHQVVAATDGDQETASITLGVADRKEVTLTLKGKPVVVDPHPHDAVITPPKPIVPTDGDYVDSRRGRRIAGFVILGVGGGALAAGGILGGIVVAKHGELADECGAELICSAEHKDEVNGYNNGRIASSVLLIGGGIIATTGLVIALASLPSSAPASAPKTSLVIGPEGAALRGSFF